MISAKIAYAAPNSVISLAEGMPNEETFPFTEITVKLNDGVEFTLEGEELGAALQYLPSQGFPPLLQVSHPNLLIYHFIFNLFSYSKQDMHFGKLHTCHLETNFMRKALTLLVNLFGAQIWIFISVSKKETRALKRTLSLVL